MLVKGTESSPQDAQPKFPRQAKPAEVGQQNVRHMQTEKLADSNWHRHTWTEILNSKHCETESQWSTYRMHSKALSNFEKIHQRAKEPTSK